MNQHGKYVRKHQWLGSDAAMAQYLSALLKYDFDRYFRKILFGQQGEASVQMSLFGMQETTALSVNRGRRAYTEKTRGLDEKRYIGNVRGADWFGRVPQIKPLCRCGRGFRSGERGERSIWSVQPTISLSVKRISCFLRKRGCRLNRLPYVSG